MVLLRKVIGDALRARRLAQHRTLREVSTVANVSLGYLSEIERGHKEASSELLASICDALGAPLSEMLGDVSATFALAEQMDEAFTSAVGGDDVESLSAALAVDSSNLSLDSRSLDAHSLDSHSLDSHPLDSHVPADAATKGELTVSVHSDGPLKTVLTAKRVPPGQRHTEPVFAA
jgi:transcriptional regulator with XRE-family HTH domain